VDANYVDSHGQSEIGFGTQLVKYATAINNCTAATEMALHRFTHTATPHLSGNTGVTPCLRARQLWRIETPTTAVRPAGRQELGRRGQ
jgi:hypothetical protein